VADWHRRDGRGGHKQPTAVAVDVARLEKGRLQNNGKGSEVRCLHVVLASGGRSGLRRSNVVQQRFSERRPRERRGKVGTWENVCATTVCGPPVGIRRGTHVGTPRMIYKGRFWHGSVRQSVGHTPCADKDFGAPVGALFQAGVDESPFSSGHPLLGAFGGA
jgi:hypothetical protein